MVTQRESCVLCAQRAFNWWRWHRWVPARTVTARPLRADRRARFRDLLASLSLRLARRGFSIGFSFVRVRRDPRGVLPQGGGGLESSAFRVGPNPRGGRGPSGRYSSGTQPFDFESERRCLSQRRVEGWGLGLGLGLGLGSFCTLLRPVDAVTDAVTLARALHGQRPQ